MGSALSRRQAAANAASGGHVAGTNGVDAAVATEPAPTGNQNYPIPRGRQGSVPSQTTTQTIRNNVNLRKATLHLVPDEADPSVLKVAFTFDAAVPCRISVFFAATVVAGDNCRIETKPNLPSGTASYAEQGVKQEFVQKAEDGLDLAKYNVEELTSNPREHIPLVIRLETCSSEGSSSDGEHIGQPLAHDVQAQTTYAKLVKHDDEGGYSVKVLKQKIWFQGTTYELKEIFGIENTKSTASAANGAGGSAYDDGSKECVICMTEPRNTAVLPCRHMCLCRECANVLRFQSNKCPICRSRVDTLLEIRVENRKPVAA